MPFWLKIWPTLIDQFFWSHPSATLCWIRGKFSDLLWRGLSCWFAWGCSFICEADLFPWFHLSWSNSLIDASRSRSEFDHQSIWSHLFDQISRQNSLQQFSIDQIGRQKRSADPSSLPTSSGMENVCSLPVQCLCSQARQRAWLCHLLSWSWCTLRMHIAFKVSRAVSRVSPTKQLSRGTYTLHPQAGAAGCCWDRMPQDAAGVRGVSVSAAPGTGEGSSLQFADAGCGRSAFRPWISRFYDETMSHLRWISGVDQHSGSSYDILWNQWNPYISMCEWATQ